MRPLAILILVLGVVFNVYSIEKKHFITTFPFQVYGEFIYMKVKVNGSRDLDFILDTGASGTVINEAIADQLGLKSSHQISVQGVSGFIDGTNLKNSNFKIGNLELKGVTLHKIPLQQLEGHIGRNIDGILGSIIFKNYIVSINYDVGSIKLYDKAGFKYTGNAEPVEIK